MAQLCGAHAKSTGKPCTRPVVKGAQRCRFHGGASPNVKRVIERRRQDAVLTEAVRTYGLPLDVSPTDALLDEVKWTAGHVAWLRARVQELEQSAVSWSIRQVVDRQGDNPSTDTTEGAAPHILLDLYQRERKHLLDVCRAALASGIEERRVRLAESQGALLADVIRRILGDLDLTAAQSAKVAEVVPRHLRAIAG